MSEPLVSVIVPIYKVEEFLEECVHSILEQTYTNFELILVDDGSPDNCGKIIDRFALADSRVKAIHKENGGLSSARNAGLDTATGKYIQFVDGDDRVMPTLLEKTVTKMEQGFDMVIFNHYIYPLQPNDWHQVEEEKTFTFSGPKDRFDFLCEKYIPGDLRWEAWNRTFSRKIIEQNRIRFIDNRKIFKEDYCFSLQYIPFINNIACITDYLYQYRKRPGSLMDVSQDDPRLKEAVLLSEMLLDYYKERPECKYFCDNYKYMRYLIFRRELCYSNDLRTWRGLDILKARRNLQKMVPDWETLSNYICDFISDKKAFKHYLRYRGGRKMLKEYMYDNMIFKMTPSAVKLMEPVYNLFEKLGIIL